MQEDDAASGHPLAIGEAALKRLRARRAACGSRPSPLELPLISGGSPSAEDGVEQRLPPCPLHGQLSAVRSCAASPLRSLPAALESLRSRRNSCASQPGSHAHSEPAVAIGPGRLLGHIDDGYTRTSDASPTRRSRRRLDRHNDQVAVLQTACVDEPRCARCPHPPSGRRDVRPCRRCPVLCGARQRRRSLPAPCRIRSSHARAAHSGTSTASAARGGTSLRSSTSAGARGIGRRRLSLMAGRRSRSLVDVGAPDDLHAGRRAVGAVQEQRHLGIGVRDRRGLRPQVGVGRHEHRRALLAGSREVGRPLADPVTQRADAEIDGLGAGRQLFRAWPRSARSGRRRPGRPPWRRCPPCAPGSWPPA